MRKIEQGIEINCNECKNLTKLKTWTKENQLKKDNNSYICRSCRQSGDKARGFAKQVKDANYWTEERRRKQSEINAGENNAMYGVSWKEFADEDTILRHSQLSGRPGKLNGMHRISIFNKMNKETTESWWEKQNKNFQRMKETGHYSNMGLISASRPIKMTLPERKVRNWLKENNLNHTYGARVENRSFDFRVGNNLIEVHGDYWHANPLYYGFNEKPLNERQQFKIEQDVIKKDISDRHKLNLIVIWETEINEGNFSKLEILKGVENETQKSKEN